MDSLVDYDFIKPCPELKITDETVSKEKQLFLMRNFVLLKLKVELSTVTFHFHVESKIREVNTPSCFMMVRAETPWVSNTKIKMDNSSINLATSKISTH